MADWLDDYQQGSFRGVEFKTKAHEFQGGRRNVDHEFPNRDEGNSEDVGKRLPRFTLDIYVIGDDYFEQRDALKDALDEEGAGELIHPYLGTFQVQVGPYTISETVEEGRLARINVSFIESGEAEFPAEEEDFFQGLFDAADAVLGFASDALEAGFSVLNAPARVATAAAALVSDAADAVDDVAKTVGSSAQGIADVGFAVKQIKADVNSIIRTPDVLAARFVAAFDLLFDAVGENNKALTEKLSGTTSNFSPDPVIGSDTPTVTKLKGNQLAFQNFIVEASVANQGKAAIQGNYVSVNEAVDVLALLNKDVDNQLPNVSNDDLFQSMRDMQVQANRGLPPQDVGEIITFTPRKALPVLVISHKIFGNISKEQEIIDQNKVRHPGFAEAGTPLEVSSG